MSGKILVVVDVGLDHHAVDSADRHRVVLMEGELDVGFAELNLLPTGGGAWMEEPWVVWTANSPEAAAFLT